MRAFLDAGVLSDRAVLHLKVFAIVAMVLDHVDTGLLGGAAGWHQTIGRVVFPIFALLLGMNLARIRDNDKLLVSLAPRMAIFGLLAAVPYVYVYGWLPLNIMFTLAASVLIVALIRQGSVVLAASVCVFAGLFVDYNWCGLAAVVGSWWAIRQGAPLGAVAVYVGAVLLPVNGNAWALLAAPLIVMGGFIEGAAPRAKWMFYVFYPVHIAVIALVKSFV